MHRWPSWAAIPDHREAPSAGAPGNRSRAVVAQTRFIQVYIGGFMQRLVPISLILLFAVGCNQRPEEHANSSAPATPEAVSPSAATPSAPSMVRFEPSVLPDCSPPSASKVLVIWDVGQAGGELVDIKIVGAGGVEELFATGGRQGSKETGPWMLPGSTLIARDHATGTELGRAAIGSGACER